MEAAAWGSFCLIYALLYAFFAYRVARWSRAHPAVAAALSMILAIFCAVGANSWFARDKAGFTHTADPGHGDRDTGRDSRLLQIVLIAAALYGFNQGWNVEEERPIGSGEDYGAGATPEDGATQLCLRPSFVGASGRFRSGREWSDLAVATGAGGVAFEPRMIEWAAASKLAKEAGFKSRCPQGLAGSSPTRRISALRPV